MQIGRSSGPQDECIQYIQGNMEIKRQHDRKQLLVFFGSNMHADGMAVPLPPPPLAAT